MLSSRGDQAISQGIGDIWIIAQVVRLIKEDLNHAGKVRKPILDAFELNEFLKVKYETVMGVHSEFEYYQEQTLGGDFVIRNGTFAVHDDFIKLS